MERRNGAPVLQWMQGMATTSSQVRCGRHDHLIPRRADTGSAVTGAAVARETLLEGKMKYLCLIYHDEKQLGSMTPSEYDALITETLAYDDEIRQSGHYVCSHALEYVETATSIRVRGDKIAITDGPFVETNEQLGGYILIEARDLNEAIRVAARMPPAQIGGIEVRPVANMTCRPVCQTHE